MTTLQTSTPNVRKFSKESLARLVEESYWPLGGAVERLEMLELDLQLEKVQADVGTSLALQKRLADQLAKLTDTTEKLKKIAEIAALQRKWDALYKRWDDLLKRRFPA
jgi:hypothetical protein